MKFLLLLIPIIVIGIVLAELLVVELKLVRGLGFLMLPIIETPIVPVAGRFLLPEREDYYLGIFSPKLGTQIMTLATTLRLSVVVMIIVVLALMW